MGFAEGATGLSSALTGALREQIALPSPPESFLRRGIGTRYSW